ncbi:MAG TPA: arginine deiminase-related protein [Agriterribacter sp.]|nr:arginine deiminase-related protein [Agriterribacter sp.]
MQTTSQLLMVRPANFGFNTQTAGNNRFQTVLDDKDIQAKALLEFDGLVQLLRDNDIDVTVLQDEPIPNTPDAIFPNNWISFHPGRTICLYPMFAANRRQERKPQFIEALKNKFGISKTIDFTRHENNNQFLEGTGSMVLDRRFNIAYACRSARTDIKVLDEFCRLMKFTPVLFDACDENGNAIYHTNVMMCVAEQYVVICNESIPDAAEKKNVISAIKMSGKKLIPISFEQLRHFAGNMLQVQNAKGELFLIMSAQAYRSLSSRQVKELEKYNSLLYAQLNTIEATGGGSARCMIAEVFL